MYPAAMLKKILAGFVVLVVIAAVAVFVRARSVLGQDGVRGAVAAQLSNALGQPVSIDALDWSVYPRVTISLQGVRIGDPVRIETRTLDVATSLGALFRRRIEHASVLLDGARIELPLPDLPATGPAAAPGEAGAGAPSAPPVEIVSIDDITLRGVEIVSGGRTLRGDVEVALQGSGLLVRRITLAADGMAVDMSGEIANLSGPVGNLTVKAGALDFNQLMAFAAEFSAGAGLQAAGSASGSPASAPSASATGEGPGMNLVVAIEAERATFGTLALSDLAGRMQATDENLMLDPVSFGVFGGRYEGVLTLVPGDTPAFSLEAALSGVDVASAMAFAGHPGLVTGTLSGTLDLAGRGLDATQATDTARGTLRVDVIDGIVSNLGLVRAIVIATSMRARANLSGAAASRDEPFTRLGGTLAIADGSARTTDLRFESRDLDLTASGSVALDGSAIDLRGQVQLSEELTREGGTDLARYTSDQGRVTLPATITGPAASPSVRIDIGAMAGRAIRNRAAEEAKKAIGRGLGGLLR
jgi:uncharacterized protein involved in outer membrane biogenesis